MSQWRRPHHEPTKGYEHGDTSEDVYAELTFRFRMRPAGYIGNDSMSAEKVTSLIDPMLATSKLMLLGGERIVEISYRWEHRGGDVGARPDRFHDEQSLYENYERIP